MTPPDDILRIIDVAAESFWFPMLDNGYIYLAATRLSLYRSDADWALGERESLRVRGVMDIDLQGMRLCVISAGGEKECVELVPSKERADVDRRDRIRRRYGPRVCRPEGRLYVVLVGGQDGSV